MTAAAALPEPTGLLAELRAFARPRLRDDVPVMWRGPSSIQIGDDVIVDRVTRAHVAWMSSLDGACSPDAIVESLTIPEHEATRLIRALLAATALEDAARIPAPLRWIPQPERDVAAGRHAAALRTYRDPEVAVAATTARARTRVGVMGRGPLVEQVTAALQCAGLARDDVHPGVIVLAGDGHPDAPVTIGSECPDLPHLPIAGYGDRATVGPLVIPGHTACLLCAQLHRRDADPAWPLLAVQWSQALGGLAVPTRDPLLMQLAALHAALLIRAWVDLPAEPEHWSGRAIDLTLPHGHARARQVPPHPLCGCRWTIDLAPD